jgi:hypothetical protein
LECVECVVERDKIGIFGYGWWVLFEGDVLKSPSPLQVIPSRIVDEDSSHNLCRDRKEVSAVFPTDALRVHQPNIRFIYQGSSLQGLLCPFLFQLAMSNPPEFLVHHRCQAGQGRLVSLAPGLKKPAYLGRLLVLRAIAEFHRSQILPGR